MAQNNEQMLLVDFIFDDVTPFRSQNGKWKAVQEIDIVKKFPRTPFVESGG